jgi:hypothetical protein
LFSFISMYFQMRRFVDGIMLTEVFCRLQWFPVCLTNRKFELQNFRGPFLRRQGHLSLLMGKLGKSVKLSAVQRHWYLLMHSKPMMFLNLRKKQQLKLQFLCFSILNVEIYIWNVITPLR